VAERFTFDAVDAFDYEEHRPGYAPEAVAWVAKRSGIVPGPLVVDLAAGTGQLSRRFVALGVDVVAVEPASNMRAVLTEQVPDVRAVDGTAESSHSTTQRSMWSWSETRSINSYARRRSRRSDAC
jgi:predicted RNA methylase